MKLKRHEYIAMCYCDVCGTYLAVRNTISIRARSHKSSLVITNVDKTFRWCPTCWQQLLKER